MDIVNILKTALVENDNNRSRSQQRELGASSVYGCSRQAWEIINQRPKCNTNTEKLAAIIGTSIHETISNSLAQNNPFDDFLIEQEFSTPELKGHIDLFIKSTKTVVDWKTITKKKISTFPSIQQTMQVQLYGYLLEANGYEVEKVCLVGICRDGTMKDTIVYEEKYDAKMAQQGLDWIKRIKEMTEPPAGERDVFFCQNYCEFYNPNAETEGVGCSAKK